MPMKVFMLKSVKNVGMAGEIVKVSEGFAVNFLIPRKFAEKVTAKNQALYEKNKKEIANREEVISSKTSLLAEKIKELNLILKRKMHDDGKLYGSVNASEVVDLLSAHGISVAKSQIEFDKNIKEKGSYEFTIKLTSKLKPKATIKIVSEAVATI